MTNKKMTKDEAEKVAKDVRDYIVGMVYIVVEGNEVIIRKGIMDDVARFPFEPPHPKIGTTCKFWNDDENDCVIGRYRGAAFNNMHLCFEVFEKSFVHCEPYTLIDPAEYAKLKKENADLKDEIKGILCKTISPLFG